MKKLATFSLLSAAVIFFVFGCAKDAEPVTSDPENRPGQDFSLEDLALMSVYAQGDFPVNKETAVRNAERYLNDIVSEGLSTRNASDFRIGKIVELTSASISDEVVNTRCASRSADASTLELPEVLAYAINFEGANGEDAGFMIVPADTRIPDEVIASAPIGSIDPDKELENDGLILFMEMAEEYLAASIVESELRIDSIKRVLVDRYSSVCDEPFTVDDIVIVNENDDTPCTRNMVVGIPRVVIKETIIRDWHFTAYASPVIPVEWGQHPPFSDSIQHKAPCGNAVTGCVATAGAQFLTYWKRPTGAIGILHYPNYGDISSYTFDWNTLEKYTSFDSWDNNREHYPQSWRWVGFMEDAPVSVRGQVADLMGVIGEKVRMDYGCGMDDCDLCEDGGSSSRAARLVSFLRSIGFTYPNGMNEMDYDYTLASGSVSFAGGGWCPVIIRGNSFKHTTNILGITYSTYSGGHCWLIDGVRSRQKTVRNVMELYMNNILQNRWEETVTYDEKLLHHNWGHDGRGNGFYSSGVFDKAKLILRSDASAPSTRADYGEAQNYKYEVKIWPYLNPNNNSGIVVPQ